MMPFATGKRACIGFNFAQMEMKVATYTLLRSFDFSLRERDRVNYGPTDDARPTWLRFNLQPYAEEEVIQSGYGCEYCAGVTM
ncbi:hypothetical protein B0H14DRAFT_2980014 [Mycena olivaceomarginata]|nr:hypothetical protein B0H14DRAFT_2980014 [Mycena olivaceomarginata]